MKPSPMRFTSAFRRLRMARSNYSSCRGHSFLVEKPLGTNLDTPRQILHEVKKAGLITSAGYHFRYSDATIKAPSRWKAGRSGWRLATGWGHAAGGLVETAGRLRGQFIEQTTHMVDLLRRLLGEADEVYAAFAHRAMQDIHEGVTVHDVGTATLKLRSGAVATISNTCLLPESDKVGLDIYTEQGSSAFNPINSSSRIKEE